MFLRFAAHFLLMSLFTVSARAVTLEVIPLGSTERQVLEKLGKPSLVVEKTPKNLIYRSFGTDQDTLRIVLDRKNQVIEISTTLKHPRALEPDFPKNSPLFVELPSSDSEDTVATEFRVGDPSRGLCWTLRGDAQLLAFSQFAPWKTSLPKKSLIQIFKEKGVAQ